MKNFHLIGQNIQTSLSPAIHNFLFQLKGVSSYKYSLHPEDNAMLTLDMMKRDNVAGVSITIPFKQSYAGDLGAGKMKNGFIQFGKRI
jgi:shikimate 5-dehydrogenase